MTEAPTAEVTAHVDASNVDASTGPSGAVAPRVEVMGIRHHGPGSARAVRTALDRLRPDVVLIEGPSDADPLALLAGDPDLVPPVALLAYAVDAPSVASFWPFAVFSPEWQALTWAAEHGVPARFCDLPTSAVLAERVTAEAPPASPGDRHVPASTPADQHEPDALRGDPLAALASAAGYADPERWWDDVVEQRTGEATPFAVVTEAMAALREDAAPLPDDLRVREERREAFMRQTIRSALRDGAQRVAVVCGAWHAPALTAPLPPAAPDARVLRGLPRRKSEVTWVPWTASRLAAASGYGAGITSPGWYHHLFTSPDDVVARWLVRVAGVLREKDLPVSSAHVIEAVRLAETLAVLRGRPLAGLEEVTEATRAVLCDGDDTALQLVTGRLVVGEALGRVPDSVPTVPLEADLRASARRLRIAPDAAPRTLELDLRKDTDLARSRLLHRLRLVGVDWGVPEADRTRTTGTFRETWTILWRPELSVAVIEASMWGTTVAGAAAARVADLASRATLPELTSLLERALVADLPESLDALLGSIETRAARDADVLHLMAALPPLVRAQRYSDVRGTNAAELAHVAATLLVRICAALPAAVGGVDDDGARTLRAAIDAVHDAVLLQDEDTESRTRWLDTLRGLADRPQLSGLLLGRVTRLLQDVGALDAADARTRFGRALSVGPSAPAKAAWVEGFLDGAGQVLARDPDLLGLLDDWVSSLAGQDFTDVVPLLRRTFGAYALGERRAVGDAVRRRTVETRGARAGAASRGAAGHALDDDGGLDGIDEALALPALLTTARLLGMSA